MTLLHTLIHPRVSIASITLERPAVRAVILRGREILMLYTRRYDDYSFPGGGLAAGEDPLAGLRRELIEETGAAVEVESYIGYVDEYRPPRKASNDVLFMRSHFYRCRVVGEQGDASPEPYEIANGMVPKWIGIGEALAHNQQILRDRPQSMGLSVERETWMLNYVAQMPSSAADGANAVSQPDDRTMPCAS